MASKESQINNQFDWVIDTAPSHRRSCPVISTINPCAIAGPKKSLIDTDSLLRGIQKKEDVEQPVNVDSGIVYTDDVSEDFLDSAGTRHKKSEKESFELNRFHPYAGPNPQIATQQGPTLTASAGVSTRNEIRDNFKCDIKPNRSWN